MTPSREQLVISLRDAHAMEKQAETMLKGQASRLEHYPELRARIQQHVEETQAQARLVGECLEQLGEDTSAIKDAGGSVLGAVGISGDTSDKDEVCAVAGIEAAGLKAVVGA